MKCRTISRRLRDGWSRSPCGERGLKYQVNQPLDLRTIQSLPVRGAWIEITAARGSWYPATSLPVRGAWIEITSTPRWSAPRKRRSPCGERGLKSLKNGWIIVRPVSLPVRGAWIEIRPPKAQEQSAAMSLPVRGAWIEMRLFGCANDTLTSLPVRGAWIEIKPVPWRLRIALVAPRAGSVD